MMPTNATAAVEYKRRSRSEGVEVVTMDMYLTPLRYCSRSPTRRDECHAGHEKQHEYDFAKRAFVEFSGSWLGWMLYGKRDEGAFRKVVLVLLLVSGVTLVASGG